MTGEQYVLAHDVGTSSVKSALISQKGEVLAHHVTSYAMNQPKPGWVEQDPEDYWNGVIVNTRAIRSISRVDPAQIVGMVFSTQSMGIILLDKNDRVLHPNITWVDGRAEEQARWLMNRLGGRAFFRSLIGIEITGKDVIPKLRWLKQNKADCYGKAVTILDVNGYLKFRATGEKVFEWSGACSYGFDLRKKDWERLVFKVAGVDLGKLPPLLRSVDLVGSLSARAAEELDLPRTVRVYGGCDDTQSAAMGSGANGEGEAHIYLGTSAWVGVSTGRYFKHKNGAVCIQSADPANNLIVGVTESAGSNLEWLIENFYRLEKNDPKVENIYAFINSETEGVPPGSDHLIFTPWLLGERCPVSTTFTRGTLFNIGHEHSRGHMVNALFEGIGYNLKWILDNLKRDFSMDVNTIRAIGGGSVNDRWIQGIANITGKKVETIAYPKLAGAIGAAACAFVGNRTFGSFNDLNALVSVEKSFIPEAESNRIFGSLFETYKAVYADLMKTYKTVNQKRFSL
ncbi:MAG: xylulokinase [Bacteroidota bacterium]